MMTAAARRSGKTVGYLRVSSIGQNEARQLDGVELDKKFVDKASGKDTKRPQLQAALDYLREGDTLAVHSMDRLGRNAQDLLRLVEDLTAKGVAVRFIKENLTFSGDDNALNKMLLGIMASFAQFERALILERQREGIALAKQAGKYRGGKAKLTPETAQQLRQRAVNGEPKAKLAKEYGLSRETVYQYIRQP